MRKTESWRAGFDNRCLATSFDAQAALYARLRPEYPAGAVDLAAPPGARRVLDLGAERVRIPVICQLWGPDRR